MSIKDINLLEPAAVITCSRLQHLCSKVSSLYWSTSDTTVTCDKAHKTSLCGDPSSFSNGQDFVWLLPVPLPATSVRGCGYGPPVPCETQIQGSPVCDVQILCGRQPYKEVMKVVQAADVVIQVLDARDPAATRSTDIEQLIRRSSPSKRIILLLNKIG